MVADFCPWGAIGTDGQPRAPTLIFTHVTRKDVLWEKWKSWLQTKRVCLACFWEATVMEGVSGMWLEGRRRGWSTDKQGRERACWVPRDMHRRMLDLEFHSASGKPVKTFLVRTAKIFKCQWASGSVSQADQSKWPAGGLSEDRLFPNAHGREWTRTRTVETRQASGKVAC